MDSAISPTPAWRSLLRPVTSARSYGALTHHLLGLPLGIAYFTWLVTGLATGAGLAITVVGIPLLTLVFASVRPLLAGERAMSNALLGTEIPSAPLAPKAEGWLGRVKAYWTDSATWRGIGYLLARFPVGTFTFSVAVAAYSSALYLLAAPIVAPLDPMELGIWEPDTVAEGLALVPLGATLLLASAWISEAMAAMSRALARWGAR
jgi:Putative sensor